MSKVLCLVAVLAGCGPSYAVLDDPLEVEYRHEFVNDFEAPCLGRVTSQFLVSKRDVVANIRLAREIFDDAGIIPRGDFCIAFTGMPVEIQKYETVDNDQWRGGMYSANTGRIYLAHNGLTLAHELLHAWDWGHAAIGGFLHERWEANGYYRADDRYKAAARSYRY